MKCNNPINLNLEILRQVICLMLKVRVKKEKMTYYAVNRGHCHIPTGPQSRHHRKMRCCFLSSESPPANRSKKPNSKPILDAHESVCRISLVTN